jgi:flagellar hook protein FlgE
MVQALLAGVASIRAQQTRMNVIGNNLANVNTTAFKGSRVAFQDMLFQTIRGANTPGRGLGGTNPLQFGLGVMVASTDINTEQGSFNATNRPGDLAIQGNGFFMLSNGQQISYSRDGGFDLDANGDLVHRATGQKVAGWSANGLGEIDTSQPVDATTAINVPVGQLATVQVTSKITMAGNLKSTAGPTDSWTTTVRVFDSLGAPHDVSITFKNRSDVTAGGGVPDGATSGWEWEAKVGDTVIGNSSSAGNERLFFNDSGRILNGNVFGKITVPGSATSGPFDVDIAFGEMGQLAIETQVQVRHQNGFPPGSLQGFSIGSDGVVTGIFTNGLTRSLGQIAIANFPNPAGLERSGSNLWRPTNNSGLAVVGEPRTGGRGAINAGFLEQSNVDIGAEFTDLIVTQRGFQANTRIVSTVDEMMQELLNMKR